MRIRLRPPFDDTEPHASSPLPRLLLEHDVSFAPNVRRPAFEVDIGSRVRQFRPATTIKLSRNVRPLWGSEGHTRLRPGLSISASPALPQGFLTVTKACERLKITPPSSCSPDRGVWIATVVQSVTFVIDPDLYESASGMMREDGTPVPGDDEDPPLATPEHVEERLAAKGFMRIVMVDGEEFIWPIDINDAGLAAGDPGLRDRLLDLVARLKDDWQLLVDACGAEDAEAAVEDAASRFGERPQRWRDEATEAAVEMVRLTRATLFETGWRRFVLPLLKAQLEPTYLTWAISSALKDRCQLRERILRDYAAESVRAFDALDPEFERWVHRTLGIHRPSGMDSPVEEKAIEIEVDENEEPSLKRPRSDVDELVTPERPRKRSRSSSSPVQHIVSGFETRASAPPPLPAAARKALKRRNRQQLDRLDTLLEDLRKVDKRIVKLVTAYISAHEDEHELNHRLKVAPMQLAIDKMELKARDRQSRFDDAAQSYSFKALEMPAPLVTTRHAGRRATPISALLQHRRGPVALPASPSLVSPSPSPPSSSPPLFAPPPVPQRPVIKRPPLVRQADVLIPLSPPSPDDKDDIEPVLRKAFSSISPTRKSIGRRPSSPSPAPPSDGEDENGDEIEEGDDDDQHLMSHPWGWRTGDEEPELEIIGDDGEEQEGPYDDSAVDMEVDELDFGEGEEIDISGSEYLSHAPLHRSLVGSYASFAHYHGFVDPTVSTDAGA